MSAAARIDGNRLWRSLMDLARVGAPPKGGVRRVTLTQADREGRDLFAAWCRDAGLELSIDAIGNMSARRAGTDPAAAPVMMGSHLDTQPSGGRFDGAYGVMAGLEVVRALNDAGLRTRAPVEVAAWTNEEGSRFVPTMMGSGVFTGGYSLEHALSQHGSAGASFPQTPKSIGYAGAYIEHPVRGYFADHDEHGAVLEDTKTTIGAVPSA